MRESGRIFAVPTYFFLAMMLGLIAAGMWRWATGDIVIAAAEGVSMHAGTTALTAFLVLRAFSNGCTAMTGVEAVSNGVPAFRPPEAKNAAATLLAMAGLAVTLFVGITLLAQAYHVMPREDETVVSQLARSIFGGRGGRATTSSSGRDHAHPGPGPRTRPTPIFRAGLHRGPRPYLPRQFMNQGDRLAFSNGIVVLSVLAGVLMVAFGGDTHALIPLYMIGVFVSFTLSQAGMVGAGGASAVPAGAPRRGDNAVGVSRPSWSCSSWP